MLSLKNIHFKTRDDDDPLTDGEHVEDGADDGHEKDCAKLVKEEPVGHKVACIEDDRREHEEEENIGGEGRGRVLRGEEEQEADDDPDDDEEARLREDVVELGGHVEPWGRYD